MTAPRGLALAAVPAFAVLLLAAFGSRGPELPSEPSRLSPGPHQLAGPFPVASFSPTTSSPPTTTPPSALDRAIDEGRLVASFQNYRAAVATGNAALQRALLPVLLRDRAAVLALARQDLEAARDAREREVARSVLQSLPQ